MKQLLRHTALLLFCVASIYCATQTPLPQPPIALFSPDDKPASTLIKLINNAKKSIHVAVYCLTDKKIAQALIDAHARGVEVKLVLDPMSADRYGKAAMLAEAKVPVFIMGRAPVEQPVANTLVTPIPTGSFSPITPNPALPKPNKPKKTFTEERFFVHDPIMHNKYAIFDGDKVWTGSFNWTHSANNLNWENALLINTPSIVQAYEANFVYLMQNAGLQPYQQAAKIHCTIPGAITGYLREKIVSALEKTTSDAELLEKLQEIINMSAIQK